MIRIHVKQQNQQFQKITLVGHACYADYGKDIVCAGVSAILTTTVNGILLIHEKAITFQQQKDFVLEIHSEDEVTQKLIFNMVSLFYELQEKYPKNIKVESEE